eukprot:COSAG04_NODE_2185_length_4594_cov_3.018242_2_plen_502_part_00
MADVLTLLRNALSAKQSVELSGAGDSLTFPDGSVHACDTPTAYKRSRGAGEPYTLGAVWFYCTHPTLGLAAYRKEAAALGLITRVDQKDLLDYVTGESDSSVAVKEAETIFDAVDTRDAKRPRLDDASAAAADTAGADSIAEAGDAAAAVADEAPDFLPHCVTVEDILAREKVLATRNSVLLAPDRKNFSEVEGLYAATKKKAKEAKKRGSARSNRQVERDMDRVRLSTKGGYYQNRTEHNPDAAMRARVGGGARTPHPPPNRQSLPAGCAKTVAWQMRTASIWEARCAKVLRRQRSRRTAAHGRPPAASPPSNAPTPRRRAAAPSHRGSSSSPQTRTPNPHHPRAFSPIADRGLGHRRGALTMYNVRSVLEEGKFVSTADAKRAGARREAKVTLRRPMKGGAVKTYEVVDNVRSLSKRDWSRVVAVFVANGKQYQFSGWPLKTPVEIFAQYCGFCLHYTDVRPDPAIKSWRVCVHPLPPALRVPKIVHLSATLHRCPGAY